MSEKELTIYSERAPRPIRLILKKGEVVDADILTSVKTSRPITPTKALEFLGLKASSLETKP